MTPSHQATLEVLLAHSSWLRHLALDLVRDAAEADDAVQETWLQVLSSRIDAARSPRAWLAGVLRHVVASRRRGAVRSRDREQRRAIPISAQSSQGDALEGLVAVERQRSLLDLVLALPEEQRRAIVLRYFEGLPPRAIATREGTSVNTVKSRLQRGLERLRDELEQKHGKGSGWAMWLLPLAKGGKATGRGAAGAAVGLGLVAALAAAVFVLSNVLTRPGGDPEHAPLATAPSTPGSADAVIASSDPSARTP